MARRIPTHEESARTMDEIDARFAGSSMSRPVPLSMASAPPEEKPFRPPYHIGAARPMNHQIPKVRIVRERRRVSEICPKTDSPHDWREIRRYGRPYKTCRACKTKRAGGVSD